MEDLAQSRNLLKPALCEGLWNSVVGTIQPCHLTVRMFLFANILSFYVLFNYEQLK